MATLPNCAGPGCNRPVASLRSGIVLCAHHFLIGCEEQLEDCARAINEQRDYDITTELVRQLLGECRQQAAEVAQSGQAFSALERERLDEIISQSKNLARRLRRSQRIKAQVPVYLCREKSEPRQRETGQTVMVSRYGALLDCRASVHTGERLVMMRTDHSRAAVGRVVSSRQRQNGHRVAVEILDCNNFWDVDWSTGNLS